MFMSSVYVGCYVIGIGKYTDTRSNISVNKILFYEYRVYFMTLNIDASCLSDLTVGLFAFFAALDAESEKARILKWA